MDDKEAFQMGYRDAMEDARRDLGAILRILVRDTTTTERMSDTRAREIFASVFGMKASDDEFGPEPTGAGVRAKLRLLPAR